MGVRTSSRTVRFNEPFLLPPVQGVLPAGSYEVETDEEQMEGLSRSAFVRVATLFTVTRGGESRVYKIKPADLDAALVRDGQEPPFEMKLGRPCST